MNKNSLVCAVALLAVVSVWPGKAGSQAQPFHVEEATIDSVHNAYRSGRLTSHQLVQLYLNRIEAYDKKGPAINAIITINPKALEEADRLDMAFSFRFRWPTSRHSDDHQGPGGCERYAHNARLNSL